MKLRTKVAALGVTAASIATAGVVYAAWTSTASGTGSAASTTSINGDISAADPHSSADLYPGAVKTAFVTITNPNDYPVVVTKIYGGSSRAVGDPACAADEVRTDARADTDGLAAALNGTEPTVIPAKADDVDGSATFELVLRMANDASDNCKSKSFVIGDNTDDDATTDTANTVDLHADIKSAATTTGNDF